MTTDGRRERVTTENGTFNFIVTAHSKKASQLRGDDVFADGAIVLKLSFQLNWIYVYVVKPGTGRCTRRRYRPEQTVQVEKWDHSRA